MKKTDMIFDHGTFFGNKYAVWRYLVVYVVGKVVASLVGPGGVGADVGPSAADSDAAHPRISVQLLTICISSTLDFTSVFSKMLCI